MKSSCCVAFAAATMLAALFLALPLCSTAAHAAGVLYTVTRTDDPPPGACLPDDCSLREAVDAASADVASFDNIEIGAGTYHVSAPALVVHGGLRISGAGVDQTVVLGDGSDELFVLDTAAQFLIEDLTMDAAGELEFDAVTTTQAALFHVRVPNPDGGILVRGSEAAQFNFTESESAAAIDCASIDRCLILDSRIAYLRSAASTYPPSNVADVVLLGATIDGALAPDHNSGALVHTSGQVMVSDTTISGTTRGAILGGLAEFGTADIDVERLNFIGNARPLTLSDIAAVRDSEFRDNVGSDPDTPNAGAIDISDTGTSVTIDRSSFINNRGTDTAGGAVLVADGASLLVRNSTFSGNSFVAESIGIIDSRGAAIGFSAGTASTTVQVQHVTIVAPSFGPAGISGTAIGGFGATNLVTLVVRNSILRGSCDFTAGTLTAATGNVESAGDTCDFDSGTNKVETSTSALAIGSLGQYGGHTPTYLPASDSVAVDAGDVAFCLDTDQRGYARPLGAGCDAGSVEAGDIIFADNFD